MFDSAICIIQSTRLCVKEKSLFSTEGCKARDKEKDFRCVGNFEEATENEQYSKEVKDQDEVS